VRDVARVWWPLAVSWLLMALEQPIVGSVVARLPAAEIHLAAWGGVVFPLVLLVEAPVSMLLSASTTLSRDRVAYRALARFTHRLGLALTLAHLALVATPAFEWIALDLMRVPQEIVDPARMGLAAMLPWTWAIAHRRLQQGVLIRYGRARLVGLGTALRLATMVTVLLALRAAAVPGVLTAVGALVAGVTAETLFAGACARRVVRRDMPQGGVDAPLRRAAFAAFYAPLALVSLMTLVVQPLSTAAIGHLPLPLASLAAWPVVTGLVLLVQSAGIPMAEVTVTLLGRPGAGRALRRFALGLAAGLTTVLAVVALTPLSPAWFTVVAGLEPHLVELVLGVIWVALPLPAVRAAQSLLHGHLVHGRRTTAIVESVAVFLVVCVAVLAAGARWGEAPGLHVALVALACGRVAETAWLLGRTRRPALR
jgi:hypothetical protein